MCLQPARPPAVARTTLLVCRLVVQLGSAAVLGQIQGPPMLASGGMRRLMHLKESDTGSSESVIHKAL